MVLRERAVSACIAKFRGQTLDFRTYDCVRLVRLALTKQGVRATPLKGLKWSSERSALKVFKEAGYDSLADGMDATGLVRIGAASAWPGDIVALPSERMGCSLMVAVGGKRLFGLDGTSVFNVIEPAGDYVAAWRVTADG